MCAAVVCGVTPIYAKYADSLSGIFVRQNLYCTLQLSTKTCNGLRDFVIEFSFNLICEIVVAINRLQCDGIVC